MTQADGKPVGTSLQPRMASALASHWTDTDALRRRALAYGKHEPSTIPEERGCEVILDYIREELNNNTAEPFLFDIDGTEYQLYLDGASGIGATANVHTDLYRDHEDLDAEDLIATPVYRITVSRVMD